MAEAGESRGAPREDLLAIADELLAEAGAMRQQWAELHRTLRGDPGAGDAETDAGRRTRAARAASEETTDPRRLIAVEMMLAGRSRAEVEDHLRREFGDDAAAEVLADVYAEGG